jgi:hypothetical protein
VPGAGAAAAAGLSGTFSGSTDDELRTAQATSTADVLAPFRDGNPLLVTDPAR